MEQKLKRQKKGKNMPEWAFLRERQHVQRHGSEKAPCIQGNTSHSAWLEKTAKTWKAREAGLKRQAGLVTQRMPEIYPVDRGSQ